MSDSQLQRLTKRAQFLFVRQGARVTRPSVMVEARRRIEGAWIGVWLTDSKKDGWAVERNRARRRLREAGRQLLPEFGLPGVDYVLVARQQTPSAPWSALLDDLRNALIRLRADLSPDAPKNGRRSPARSASESD
jgi:ribonuclease P protein component